MNSGRVTKLQPLREEWQRIARTRTRVRNSLDRIVLLSDFLKLFDAGSAVQNPLIVQDSFMRTRFEFMSIVLNFVISKRFKMFELHRLNDQTQAHDYIRELFAPTEASMKPDEYLDAALAAQAVMAPDENGRTESKGRILFGQSKRVTPCFYLGDILNAVSRQMMDPNLRMAQVVGVLGSKGPEFNSLLHGMASLRDYSHHFPNHPREGRRKTKTEIVQGASGGWLSGGLRPVPIALKR